MRASGFGGAQLGYAFVELACAVGNDAELALDEHELGAVVHFVFLGAEEAFETRFHGFAIGLGNSYDEKFGRQGFQPGSKILAVGAQEFHDFRLGAGLGLFGNGCSWIRKYPRLPEWFEKRLPILYHRKT